MKWNYRGKLEQTTFIIIFTEVILGTALLVLCSTDMSENSYYGDTMLQHLNRNGDSSSIQLSKKTIHFFRMLTSSTLFQW